MGIVTNAVTVFMTFISCVTGLTTPTITRYTESFKVCTRSRT